MNKLRSHIESLRKLGLSRILEHASSCIQGVGLGVVLMLGSQRLHATPGLWVDSLPVANLKLVREAPARLLTCGDAELLARYLNTGFVTFDAPVFAASQPLIVVLSTAVQQDHCGAGVLLRTFRATEVSSGERVVTTQRVTIVPMFDYEVKFPSDATYASLGGDVLADTVRQDRDIRNWGCRAPHVIYDDSSWERTSEGTAFRFVRTHHLLECGITDVSEASAVDLEALVGTDLLSATLSVSADGTVKVNGVELPKVETTGHWIFRQVITVVDKPGLNLSTEAISVKN